MEFQRRLGFRGGFDLAEHEEGRRSAASLLLGWLWLAAARLEAAGSEKASLLRPKHNGTKTSLQQWKNTTRRPVSARRNRKGKTLVWARLTGGLAWRGRAQEFDAVTVARTGTPRAPGRGHGVVVVAQIDIGVTVAVSMAGMDVVVDTGRGRGAWRGRGHGGEVLGEEGVRGSWRGPGHGRCRA